MGNPAFECFYWYFFVSGIENWQNDGWRAVLKKMPPLKRSDYLWLLAMLMTSPLVVTLGISLTVRDLIHTKLIKAFKLIIVSG